MNRRSLFLAGCLSVASVVLADDPPQYRAVYVPSFDTNTEARCAQVVSQVLNTNLNQVLVQVRARADAAYFPNREDSTYPNPEPRGQLYTLDPTDLDVLQYYIDRFHNATPRREVVAWMTTFNTWNRSTPPASASHVYRAHPEWITEDSSGATYTYGEDAPLDPGIPAVRDYLYNVFMDVVRNYDVDGVQFDYIRLISSDAGYDPVAKAAFLADTGWNIDTQNANGELSEVYEAWRRDQITRLVERVHRQTLLEKPWVDVSTFLVNFSDSVEVLAQGYNYWASHQSVDVLYPGCYSSTVSGTTGDWDFYVSKLAQNGDQNSLPMVAAIGSYLFLPDDPAYNNTAVQTLESNSRKPNGYAFYAKGALFDDGTSSNDQLAQALFNAGGPMDAWAPIPAIPHKAALGEETTPPNAPASLAVTLNGGVPHVAFDRPAAASDGDLPVHYRLYRSSSAAVNLYYDNMVMEWWDLDSSRASFAFDDATAPSGSVYYKAVAYDDWNNRAVSGAVSTSVSASEYIIETRAGGKNVADYSESGSFSDSSSHSTAPGTTASIGSRFALPGDGNGRNDQARFSPSNLTTGEYDVYITTFNFSSANAQNVTARFVDMDGTHTSTFDLTAANCGNVWYKIGTLDYLAGAGNYVEIDNSTQTNVGSVSDSRMNMAALRLVGTSAVTPTPKELKPPVAEADSGDTEVVVDSDPPSLNYDDNGSSGHWTAATYPGYFGGTARVFPPTSYPVRDYAVWVVDLPREGHWAIEGWTRNNVAFARGAQYRFVDGTGAVINTNVTQRSTYNDTDTGDWIINADGVEDDQAYWFPKGRVYVTVWGNTTGSEYIIADALRFRLVEPTPTDIWSVQ